MLAEGDFFQQRSPVFDSALLKLGASKWVLRKLQALCELASTAEN
jgi:hypothetical protein